MKIFQVSIISVLLILCSGLERQIDEETIEITGDPDPVTLDSEELTTSSPSEARAGITVNCITSRGESGQCKKFNECYPLFRMINGEFLEDEPKSSPRKTTTNYFELEAIYRNISGPCDKDILEVISSIDGNNRADPEEYVCCPDEKEPVPSEPSRPPAQPTPPPDPSEDGGEAQGHCGKVLIKIPNVEVKSTTGNSSSEDVTEQRIVNGRNARRGEFPWTVALMNRGRQFCGGSLISSQHILTAAHCVTFMNRGDVKRLRIRIGDHNLYSTKDGPHEVRSVTNVYYHRRFSMKTLYHDVSVIRLNKPVKFTQRIQPVCLYSTALGRYDDGKTYANVAGWGQISAKGGQSNILKTVRVPVLPQKVCKRRYQGKAPAGIISGMVCAGGRGKDSCKGDSGGPLTIKQNSRNYQIGIVSWGIGCATYPGVYTRVDQYLTWITKNQR